MPEAFLHIGQPKTGTTSIQTALVTHADIIASSGIYPSRMLWCKNANLGPLNIVFSEEDRFTPAKFNFVKNQGISGISRLKMRVKEALEGELNLGFDKYVYSNEGLYLLDSPSEMHAIARAFSGFSLRVVLYLRNPADFLASQFPTKLIPRIFNDLPQNLSQMIDYKNRISTLEEVFGKKNVHVLNYDAVDVVESFFSLLGCESDFVSSIPKYRENPRTSYTKLLKEGNEHLFLGRTLTEALIASDYK